MFRYAVLASGSTGNSTLIQTDVANVLIDCGIKTKKQMLSALSSCGLGYDDIERIYITHSHGDHIDGLRFFPEEKFWTYPGMLDGKFDTDPDHTFEFNVPSVYKDLTITPLRLSHDVPNTCGFLVESQGKSLVYITDTGYLRDSVLKRIANRTYYVFESNHDVAMLYNSSRPAPLIRRIHSDKGHMDNVEASTYLSNLIGPDTKEITFAHLSEECNTPEVCLETYEKVMTAQKGEVPEGILVRCAPAAEVLKGGDYLYHD